MILTFQKRGKLKMDESKLLRSRLKQIDESIEKPEERFAWGDIERPVFGKVMAKCKLTMCFNLQWLRFWTSK
jgi:hypothetical protein